MRGAIAFRWGQQHRSVLSAAVRLGLAVVVLLGLLSLLGAASRESRIQVDPADLSVWIAMCAAVVIPFAWRVVRGRLDPFEPLLLATLAFVVLFLIRTAFDIARDNRVFAGVIDVSATYREALLATLIAIVAFQLGYAVRAAPRVASRLPAPPPVVSDAVLLVAGLVLTILAGAALVAKGLLAGGLDTLLLNRSQAAIDLSVPIISESVMLAVPACLLLWSVSRRATVMGLAFSAAPVAIVLVASLPSGDRRYLLEALFAAGIYLFLRFGRRPSVKLVTAAALLAFFFVITPLRVARGGEVDYWDGVAQAVGDPLSAVEELFRVGDTEMVSTLAFLMQNVGPDREINWQYGLSFLTETVLQPIPRELWPDKPKPIRSQIIEANWGMAAGRCISICPTFSILGSLYADLGMLSVALGSAGFGFVLRCWFEYFRSWHRSTLAQIAYAPTVFLAFYAWWSSLSVLVLGLGLFVFPIVLIALAMSNRGWSASLRRSPAPA